MESPIPPQQRVPKESEEQEQESNVLQEHKRLSLLEWIWQVKTGNKKGSDLLVLKRERVQYINNKEED